MATFFERLYAAHRQAEHRLSRTDICKLTDRLLQLLFPPLAERHFADLADVARFHDEGLIELTRILAPLADDLPQPPRAVAEAFFAELPAVYELLLGDATAIAEGDPAAHDRDEVIRTYPGFYAIAFYRLAHTLYGLGVLRLPRIITEYAHSQTGIDIHPGATVGPHFCIDHGTGVVVGQTCRIGAHVKVYQGVTLGAVSVSKQMGAQKRHPTIEDHVVIYSNATILGGHTTVGNHSVIGGNVWLTESVPPYSRVYHEPQITVRPRSAPDGALNYSI